MNSVLHEIVTCLLLLTVVRGISVPAEQIIYVDKVNRTLDPCCWEDKSECSNVEVTLDCVELHNSTLVVVKPKCKCKDLQESAVTASHDPQCPTWFFPDPSSNGTCRCGNDIHDAVRCNNSTKTASILDCYCMTYDKLMGPVVGACFYNCEKKFFSKRRIISSITI